MTAPSGCARRKAFQAAAVLAPGCLLRAFLLAVCFFDGAFAFGDSSLFVSGCASVVFFGCDLSSLWSGPWMEASGLIGLGSRSPTHGSAHRRPRYVDPADARDRLAADQAPLVEEPLVGAVEFLKRVIAQHDRVRPVGNLQDEGVAAADDASRRRDDLVVVDRLASGLTFALRDPMLERGVDDDGDPLEVILGDELCDRFVELLQRRLAASLGGDIGSVDDRVRSAWRPVNHVGTLRR